MTKMKIESMTRAVIEAKARVALTREPGDDTTLEHQFCPFCKIRLQAIHEQWRSLLFLEAEGRVSLAVAQREVRRAAVFTQCASP